MNDAKDFAWWHLGFRWFVIRMWWRRLPERLAWWLAWLLPRQVALFAFVRVYSAWGECGPDYAPVYQAWEQPRSINAVDPVAGVVAEVRRAPDDSSSLPSAAPHPARTEE